LSSRRSHLTLVTLILLALAGVVALGLPGSPAHKTLHKGLDLQGGLEVVLKAQPPKGHKLTPADLDRSVTIMRNRVDKLGVSEPEIRKQGTDQIVIELDGVHNVNQAAQLIGKTAQLELYDLEPALVPPSTSSSGPVATRRLYDLLSRVQASAKSGTPSATAPLRATPHAREISPCEPASETKTTSPPTPPSAYPAAAMT